MVAFPDAPLPGDTPDIRSDVSGWARSLAMTALVAAFDGDAESAPADAEGRLAWLDGFSDRWDTRQGRERDLAAELDLDEKQRETVHAAADALGFRHVRPPKETSYDVIFILGGLIRACLSRPLYAAQLVRMYALDVGLVAALGGFRPFSEPEQALARRLRLVDIGDEYEALDYGTRTAFSAATPVRERGQTSELPGGSWRVREYESDQGISLIVAAAPSSEPETRRANTADTYVWFAEELAHIERGKRVLAVTTSIYVPAQHAAAVRTLAIPFGVAVETIGVDASMTPDELAQGFSATKYLLEVRSAIRSMQSLLEAL
jgi:hypothetical protein